MKHASRIRLAAALAGFGLAAVASAQASEFEPRLKLDTPKGAPRVVALTFDACSGGVDDRVLAALAETGAKATIFATERWIRKNPAALAVLKAHPEQFEIENHGAAHIAAITDRASLFGVRTAATLEGVRAEVRGGAAAVEAATGRRPAWFRGATARYTRDALDAIAADGQRVAGFSLNADMGASLPARTVAKRMEGAVSGDVIIAHMNQPNRPSGAGVADGIRALKAAGFAFARLDEMRTKSDDGRLLLTAGREVPHKLDVQGDDHGRDEAGHNRHPARSDEVAHLRPAGREPDQRDHREGQLQAEHDLAQHK